MESLFTRWSEILGYITTDFLTLILASIGISILLYAFALIIQAFMPFFKSKEDEEEDGI
ncbi:MAG: hypothetical protein HQL10_13995 [Nitrospirae bacterium]|nr:hypothetical protein [Nitrospirota bacterium]